MKHASRRLRAWLISDVGQNMKLVFLALLLSPICSWSAELMDRPLHFGSLEEAIRIMKSMAEDLPEADRTFFIAGFERLDIAFTRYLPAELKKEERKAAFVAAVDGLTPRQIILLGTTFFGHQVAIEAAQEKRNAPREFELVVTAQRRYHKRANKSPEPTPTAVTPRAEERKLK